MKNNTSAIQTYKKGCSKTNHVVLKSKVQQYHLSQLLFPEAYHVTLFIFESRDSVPDFFFYSSSLHSTSSCIEQSQKVNIFCISSVLDCSPKELQSKAPPNKFLSETERFIMSMLNLAQLSVTIMEQRAHMSHLYPRKILNTTFSE